MKKSKNKKKTKKGENKRPLANKTQKTLEPYLSPTKKT
jgi:hypothetical protein